MALDYTKIPTQFGAILKILRKREALLDHALKATDSSYHSRLLSQANGFSQSVDVEKKAYGKQLEYFEGTEKNNLRSIWTGYRSEVESLDDFFGVLRAGLPLTQDDLNAGAIDYEYDLTNDVVSIVNYKGFLGALRNDMLAGSYYVTPNSITPGSFTAKTGNRGALTATSMSYLSHMLSGTLVFEVVDESVDQPKLKCYLELLEPMPDGTTIIEVDNDINVDKAYEDGPTGLVCTISRSGLAAPTETGDGGNLFASTSISNPAEDDMNGGVLQVRVTRQASGDTWLIEFFNSSDRALSNKVGSATVNGTTGTVAIDVTLSSDTRFQSTFSKANAHSALPSAADKDDDISFDIETPRKGDRWTRVVTNDYAGNFSTKIAKAWRISLPTSGSNLFTDSLAASVSMS